MKLEPFRELMREAFGLGEEARESFIPAGHTILAAGTIIKSPDKHLAIGQPVYLRPDGHFSQVVSPDPAVLVLGIAVTADTIRLSSETAYQL